MTIRKAKNAAAGVAARCLVFQRGPAEAEVERKQPLSHLSPTEHTGTPCFKRRSQKLCGSSRDWLATTRVSEEARAAVSVFLSFVPFANP